MPIILCVCGGFKILKSVFRWISVCFLVIHFDTGSDAQVSGYRPKIDESGMVGRVDNACREDRVGNPKSAFPQVNIIGTVMDESPCLICVEDPQ